MHSSRENSQYKGPGQERTCYVKGIKSSVMLSELISRWAREVIGVCQRGEVGPVGWSLSSFSVHLSHLGILLKCKILT